MTNKIQRTSGKESGKLKIEFDCGCSQPEFKGECECGGKRKIEKTYKLSPLRFGHYGEMEQYVMSLRACPIEIAATKAAGLSEANKESLWGAAVRAATFAKLVPAVEMANFEKSIEGIAWKLWKCLPDHPEIDSPLAATKILIAAGAERLAEIKAKLVVWSGESDLKK